MSTKSIYFNVFQVSPAMYVSNHYGINLLGDFISNGDVFSFLISNRWRHDRKFNHVTCPRGVICRLEPLWERRGRHSTSLPFTSCTGLLASRNFEVFSSKVVRARVYLALRKKARSFAKIQIKHVCRSSSIFFLKKS